MNKKLLLCALLLGTVSTSTAMAGDLTVNTDNSYVVISDNDNVTYDNVNIQDNGVLHLNGNGKLTVTNAITAITNGTSTDNITCAIQNDGTIITNSLTLENGANLSTIYPFWYHLGNLTISNGGSSSSASKITQEYFTLNGGTFTNAGTLDIYNTITNNSNATLINVGSIVNNDNVSITNEGTLNNSGIANAGAITNSGSIDNSGTATISNITNSGTLNNSGTIKANNSITNNGSLSNTGTVSTSTLTNSGSLTSTNIILGATGSDNNTIYISNKLTNESKGNILADTITVNTNFTLDNSGTIEANNSITNSGSLSNTGTVSASDLTNSGSISSTNIILGTTGSDNNTIYVSNKLTNESKGNILADTITVNTNSTLDNSGTIVDMGDRVSTITNSGAINNSGKIWVDEISNQTDATLTNSGTLADSSKLVKITNEGTITNTGTIYSSTLTNSNLITNTNGYIQVQNIANTGTITGGEIQVRDDSSNFGTINVATLNIENGSFDNSSSIVVTTLKNEEDTDLTNTGTIKATSFNNYGKVTTSDFVVGTTSKNTASISVTGNEFTNSSSGNILTDTLTVNTNASLTNNGTIGSEDSLVTTITNEGTFNNRSSVYVKTLNNSENATFTNNGTLGSSENLVSSITNEGTFENSGSGIVYLTTLNNSENATFTNNGTLGSSENLVSSITNEGTFENGKDANLNVTTYTNKYITNNNGTIIASTIANEENATLTNTGAITTESLTNNGSIKTTSIVLGETLDTVSDGTINITESEFTNSQNGSILAETITVATDASFVNNGAIGDENNLVSTVTNNGSFTNFQTGTLYVDEFLNSNSVTNNGNIIATAIANNEDATLTNSSTGVLTSENYTNLGTTINNNLMMVGKLTNSGDLTGESGILTITSGSNTGSISQNEITITKGEFTNNGTVESPTLTIDESATLNNSESGSDLNVSNLTNKGSLYLTNGSSTTIETLDSTGYIRLVKVSDINISKGSISGILDVLDGESSLNADTLELSGNVNIGDSVSNAILNLNGGTITSDVLVNIASGGRLNITKDNTNVTLNSSDNLSGDISLSDGNLTLDNFNIVSGATSTLEGGTQQYYEQSGGKLNLTNNSSLTMTDSTNISGGTMVIDDNSKFTSLANGYKLDELTISGLHEAMNTKQEDYNISNVFIGNSSTGDSQADFTVDFIARSNKRNTSDHFIADSIQEADGLSSATINISDWTLGGDIYGYDAPIDRNINLGKVFSGQISENINFTATDKETFTPIGWYRLNAQAGGNYTLNLTRFNPQVYRGQVTTVAQYMNQLNIDDMLFTHSMVLPSFKDDNIAGMSSNRYASTNPLFAPYQYSKKDGGIWVKMYGTFENLQMNNGIGKIGNNAYGTLIGADFGLKELKKGWKFMPTAYIGYNGAHQTFAKVGAYQNGGQIGFLGTWYKENTIIGGLVYGGAYGNSMSVYGHTDDTFNYYGGAATKIAHNIRLHKDWVLQPSIMAAYNFFGQQNWHSDFGQMGMMSSTLNGVNIAPGLNLIWEKETFSAYATIQYMFNVNGAVGGRAGNVSLAHTEMERGYIQYGLGFVKKFSDRFSGYLQAVLRNVGRTGVGFQLGFNIKLGK